MRERIVDTSPLIFLAYLDKLELLKLDVQRVLVPRAVLQEIQAKQDLASKRVEEAFSQWLEVCDVSQREFLKFLGDLGEGEAEVIAQAVERKVASVVLDDLDARRRASMLDLKPIGTVGLLLAAKKRELIPSLKTELRRLRDLGFYISEELRRMALEEAGEMGNHQGNK